MEYHNAIEVGLIIGVDEKTVGTRCKKLGLKKISGRWMLNYLDIEKIKKAGYVRKPEIQFSECGNFLIIPSIINRKNYKL